MILRDHRDARGETLLEADVVVVGTGPGGAAAARVLAASGRRVVMVEQGRPRLAPEREGHRHRLLDAGLLVAHGTPLVEIGGGRGVGGGALVGMGAAVRAPAAVLEAWAGLGLGDPTPAYRDLEAHLGVAVPPEALVGGNDRLLLRGARARGWRAALMPRAAPGCRGCGVCRVGCPHDALARIVPEGAVIQADVRVDAIDVERDRAVGVRGDVWGAEGVVGRLTVRAPRVVLACGAIGTPRLLHASGLASRLGRAVGTGLHLNPGVVVYARMPEPMEGGIDQAAWVGAVTGLDGTPVPGVRLSAWSPTPAELLVDLGVQRARARLAERDRYGAVRVTLADTGSARVRHGVDHRFAPHDVHRLERGVVAAAAALLAGGADCVWPVVHGVGWHRDPVALEAALSPVPIADFVLSTTEPLSSCRLGHDPATSVVGPTGEAHRLPGLFVADGSMLPSAPGVPPALTIAAVATVLAQGM